MASTPVKKGPMPPKERVNGTDTIFLTSATTEVAAYDFDHEGFCFSLVDTPGFDDSRGNDEAIVDGILRWLEESAASGKKLNGILYFHRIIDPKASGVARQNLRLFRKLCGDDNLASVLLVTTFWNEVDPKLGERRELLLQRAPDFWKPMIDRGSSVVRSKQDRPEDLTILLRVANRSQEFYTQAQKSMRDGKTRAEVACESHDASSLSETARQELVAQANRLAKERERLEALQRQQAKEREDALELEKAMQKQRQLQAEEKKRKERERQEMLQRMREEADRAEREVAERKMREMRQEMERRERLQREEAERREMYESHVCSNIPLKRRACSGCSSRMDWIGDGLWCYREFFSPSYCIPFSKRFQIPNPKPPTSLHATEYDISSSHQLTTCPSISADCCHCDWDQFYLCQQCGVGSRCKDPQHPVLKVRLIPQTVSTSLARMIFSE